MSLRQLEYFVGVVDEGSFTIAAARLRVTQPALSHQVAALERSLGTPLLRRSGRAVHLTAAGRAALPHARAALAAAAAVRRATADASGLLAGEVHIATVFSVSIGVLPSLLATWTAAHASVDLQLEEHPHVDAMHAAVREGRADVGIGPAPASWDGPMAHLAAEEFVVVLPHGGNIPPDGAIDLASLRDRRWVHYAREHGLAAVLDEACGAAGFVPRVAVRVEQTASAPALAAAGVGPALVPANMLPVSFEAAVARLRTPIRRELSVFGAPGDPVVATLVSSLASAASPPTG